MPKHDAQHTDSINRAPLHTASSAGNEPKTVAQASVTTIAGEQNFGEQHITGRGGENPGASIKKQTSNNA